MSVCMCVLCKLCLNFLVNKNVVHVQYSLILNFTILLSAFYMYCIEFVKMSLYCMKILKKSVAVFIT